MFCKIIDNFINKSYFEELQQALQGDEFPWYYNNNISLLDKEDTTFSNYGFTHWLYNDYGVTDSQVAHFVRPLTSQILDATECNKILRVRADMVTWSPNNFLHNAHQDFSFPHKASVFYINESDGDTVFYNVTKNQYNRNCKIQKRVSPKPNRLVIFDGDLMHSGHSPTKYKRRIIINSNFKNSYT
tara:strand:- start:531 stop:1088 length:558 start_codon:yes stop_codon:yes gene_type:complete